MHNFGTLLGFELKKLLINKVTILMLFLFTGLLFGITMLEYLVIAPDDRYVAQREFALEGKKLDDIMLKRIEDEAEKYGSLTRIDGNSIYYHLAQYLIRALGTYLNVPDTVSAVSTTPLTAESFYQNRENTLEYLFDNFLLEENEKAFWRSKESEITKPFTWKANYGISAMRRNYGMLITLAMLTIGICLSGIFASESRYRTDALIECTMEGKGTLPLVKILAGELFSLIVSFLLLAAAQLPNILFNGFHGFETACQIIAPFFSYTWTSGKLLLVYTGVYFLASLLIGSIAIVLSKLINNMIAVSGCICFTVLLDLFTTIPSEFRILSQIRSFTPLQVLINSSVMDPRLLRVGQRYLTVFQSAPIIYGVITIVLCLITISISRKHIFPG